MAINDVFNSLEFDGVNSLSNGVFITGEAVYDAPERDVEMIEIPGRNGDFQLDNGRWKNIEVTYKAGAFGADQTEFATKIRNYRNLLASRIGYKRLTDTYNPDEYRLGTFVDAFEAETASRKRAGEFDLIFNCKPQRWLTSGEQELTVADGGIVTNPTPYDASPLLMVEGYGAIDFNGYEINIKNEALGETYVGGAGQVTVARSASYAIELDDSLYNTGDLLTLKGLSALFNESTYTTAQSPTPRSFTGNGTFADGTSNIRRTLEASKSAKHRGVLVSLKDLEFTAGTAATFDESVSYRIDSINESTGTIIPTSMGCHLKAEYDGDSTITITKLSTTTQSNFIYLGSGDYVNPWEVYADSSKPALGHPTYIDCDLGEAYLLQYGTPVSLNQHIDLGSDLPVLAPGANTFTVDNTITSLKVIPRWFIL